MRSADFTLLPAPTTLKDNVECVRIAEFKGNNAVAIKVCPNGLPGIVFQVNHRGQTAIANISTKAHTEHVVPTLFLHGQVTQLALMNFKSGPYTTIQIVLKPYALRSLFGLDASALTNRHIPDDQFATKELTSKLLVADNQERVQILAGFLFSQAQLHHARDTLVEKCVHFIQQNIRTITVRSLLETVPISERQFQKRFLQTTGVTPQFYIRVRRVNEAIRLMDSGSYTRLSDVAYALNFHDQAHFIHDIKAFSGITPKNISQRVSDFHHDEVAASYIQQ